MLVAEIKRRRHRIHIGGHDPAAAELLDGIPESADKRHAARRRRDENVDSLHRRDPHWTGVPASIRTRARLPITEFMNSGDMPAAGRRASSIPTWIVSPGAIGRFA